MSRCLLTGHVVQHQHQAQMLVLVSESDPSATQVVGGQFHCHPIACKNSNPKPSHLTGNGAEYGVSVLQENAERGVGEYLGHLALEFYRLVFCHQTRLSGSHSATCRFEGSHEAIDGASPQPKKGHPRLLSGWPDLTVTIGAGRSVTELDYVLCCWTLLALHDVELDPLTLRKGLESTSLNRGVVYETIALTIFWRDETVSLGVVEPLHFPGSTH
jgi:hypothetical protein